MNCGQSKNAVSAGILWQGELGTKTVLCGRQGVHPVQLLGNPLVLNDEKGDRGDIHGRLPVYRAATGWWNSFQVCPSFVRAAKRKLPKSTSPRGRLAG